MSQRQADLLWLRDTLEHLRSCQKQLEWSNDATATHFLAESMIRDLDRCRRICQKFNRRAALVSMN